MSGAGGASSAGAGSASGGAALLRLRQVALVARELEPVVDALCDVLGVEVCFRDHDGVTLPQFRLAGGDV